MKVSLRSVDKKVVHEMEDSIAPGEIKDDRRVVLDYEEPSDHEDQEKMDTRKDLSIQRTVLQVYMAGHGAVYTTGHCIVYMDPTTVILLFMFTFRRLQAMMRRLNPHKRTKVSLDMKPAHY